MSELDRLELFTYVAQAASLTQAASQLDLTKTSLSKQIKRLEIDLKVDLFSRQGQRLQLTAHGKVLLRQCLRLKKELDDTRAICQQFHEEPEGTLHIAAFEHFAQQLIFPKLKVFLTCYPKLQLFVDTSERVPHFEREQIDLAVGYSLQVPDDIVQKRIVSTRYVLCASEQYFAQKGRPASLDDLSEHLYIDHKIRTEKHCLNLKPGYKVSLKPYLLLNRVNAMIECAKAGLGLIQLPMYLMEKYLKEGSLVEVLASYQATDANVYYYYPKYRHIQPKVRKFIDFFLTD